VSPDHQLLSREAFREGTLARDRHRCVFCSETKNIVAHHILERRLWSDGGYYLANGASVCEPHHMECERTVISVEDVRAACGITKPIIPDHLYDDEIYDKWGNNILGNGMRLRGELFFDESVQKVLGQGGVLNLFTNRVKFPRTYHLPWSLGINDDDRVMTDLSRFIGKRVIVHEKMDGENTTMYSDYLHARSIDGRSHSSRDWVKGLWGRVAHDIPQDWRVIAENMYAKHSIAYDSLPSYALGFQVWNEKNVCLAWDDTADWLDMLEIERCPKIYDGLYDEKIIRGLYNEKTDWETREGYVMRVAEAFSYRDYRHCVGKFVRKGHVQTTKHWMHGQRIEVNGLKG
jgi:hypothetical protein